MEMETVEGFVGKAIMDRRKKLGMTATFLAKEAGITGGFLHDIEVGRRPPSVPTLVAIAKVLNLSAAEVLPLPKPVIESSSGDDIHVLLRIRREHPEIIQMLAIPGLTDQQIIAAYGAALSPDK